MSKISIVGTRYLELQLNPEEFASLAATSRHVHAVARRPGVYRCSLKYIPEILYVLRGQTEENIPDGPAAKLLRAELERRRMTAELKMQGTTVEYPGLWEHQNLGVELARYNDRYNFFYDTRTGKTRMTFQIIQNALEAGKIKRALVIVPSTIIPSWLDDAKHFPMKVAAYYGDYKMKAKALKTPCHIMLWSTGMVVSEINLIKACKFDMVILDESSKCKSRTTQIAKTLLDYSDTVKYWYNLSATPAPNGEEEYFCQMQFVDKYLFNPVWTHFKNRYFDDISFSDKYEKLQLKDNLRTEFMQLVESCSIYVDQSVMPMAESSWEIVPFELSASDFSAYETMRKEMVVEVAETTIVADAAVIARTKLQQICSGFVMDTKARVDNALARKLGLVANAQETYILPGDCKRIEALLQLLAKLGNQPVVIWAHYAQEFKDIENVLTTNCRIINGKTPSMLKNQYVTEFKEKKFQYLVAHPLSLGMGVNLTVAHSCVYYRVTDSWESLKQSSERIRAHKDIQPFQCDYYVLIATAQGGKRLVDSLVYDNVTSKRDASTGFLNYLRSGEYGEQAVHDYAIPG